MNQSRRGRGGRRNVEPEQILDELAPQGQSDSIVTPPDINPLKKANRVIIKRTQSDALKVVNRKIEFLVGVLLTLSVFVASASLLEIAWLGRHVAASISAEYALEIDTNKAMKDIIKRLQVDLDGIEKVNPTTTTSATKKTP